MAVSDAQGCSHGSDPRRCAECQETTPAPPTPAWRRVVTFSAKFAGTCTGCGEPTAAGETITRWDRGDGTNAEIGYTHADCRPRGRCES